MIPTISAISIWAIIKVFLMILLSMYIIFAIVMIRQIQLMTTTLKVGFETELKFLALVHFLFAVAVLIFSILIL